MISSILLALYNEYNHSKMTETQSVLCNIINQIFQIEQKCNQELESKGLQRKFRRIDQHLQELELEVHNPIGENYDDTRLDCEATISGDDTDNLKIIEVIKPIVYHKGNHNTILQRAVVIVAKEK